MVREPRIAFVQDTLPFPGGAEKVLEAALEAFPGAQVYTLVYNREAFRGSALSSYEIHTSFIDRLPGAHRYHRTYLPLMPLAIEKLDLRGYDIIVSFSYATAHGITVRPGQLHICYMYTPLRYAWQRSDLAAEKIPSSLPPIRWISRAYFHYFRTWDMAAAAGINHLVTVSQWMADCIRQIYQRQADVLYPPVDVEIFQPCSERQDFYLMASRLVSHKRVELAVDAFTKLNRPLKIVGEGPDLARLKKMAGPNVNFLGWQPQEELAELMGQARAFVHTCGEDFGIAMVEAQSAGCPVITVDQGSAHELVQPGKTGLLYSEQTVESLSQAVEQFERGGYSFDTAGIHETARRFSRPLFLDGFHSLVIRDWERSQHGPAAYSAG